MKYKAKVNPKDCRYYTIKANFSYLLNYGIDVVAEIGRGGYGVVYKVDILLYRHCAPNGVINKGK